MAKRRLAYPMLAALAVGTIAAAYWIGRLEGQQDSNDERISSIETQLAQWNADGKAPEAAAKPASIHLPWIGEWENQESTNRFRTRIQWNEAAWRYEGRLTDLGLVSRWVGFRLGELWWKGTPTEDPRELDGEFKWRTGRMGSSIRQEWKKGTSRLEEDFIHLSSGHILKRVTE